MRAFAQGARPWWPVAAVVLVAVAVRLYQLDDLSLWTDELFTKFYPDAGLPFLWSDGLRTEPTPPLYYTFIWAVERTLGSSAWAVRAPSVAASLAEVWLAWALSRELFGRSRMAPALLAMLLLAIAPINVLYAQEARVYALQGAALGLALLGFARMLRGASGAVPYVVGAVLAIWLHPTSVAAVAGMNVAALVSAVGRGRLLDRPALLRWIGVNAVVAVACIPLVASMLGPASGAATSWIPRLTVGWLESVVWQTLGGPALELNRKLAVVSVLALAALALIPPWRPGWRPALVLVVAPGVALAVMIGISVAKPVLLTRTLAWLMIPLAVVLGDILSRRPVILRAAAVAVVGVALANQFNHLAALKEDWRGLFAQMPGLTPSGLIVLGPHSPPGAVAIYAPEAGKPVRLDDGGPPIPETVVMPHLFGTETVGREVLAKAIQAGRPVWFIYRRPEWAWAQQVLAGLPSPQRVVQSEPGSNPALSAVQWRPSSQ